jgi:hypothetical protein
MTNLTYVTPGMFEALQIPLHRGRFFTDSDNSSGAKVMIVNEAFVRRFVPKNIDALGITVQPGKMAYHVVGIVADVQQKNGWGRRWGPLDAFPQVYVPVDQISDDAFALVNTWFSPSFVIRTRGDIHGLPEAISRALAAVDPQLPVSAFHTMPELRRDSLKQQRYQALLFSTLAGIAILLAALGVYGLIAQSVATRTREMGIRLALGATTHQLVGTAAYPGIGLSAAGVFCGIALGLFATRLIKSMVWGVSTTDPGTFVLVAVLLIAVAGMASLIPALRLTRLDPAQTLRHE